MPYSKNSDLPSDVKRILPEHAQDIYRSAFNSAWDEYDKPSERRGNKSREGTASAVAWNAVESKYKKDGKTGKWKAK